MLIIVIIAEMILIVIVIVESCVALVHDAESNRFASAIHYTILNGAS